MSMTAKKYTMPMRAEMTRDQRVESREAMKAASSVKAARMATFTQAGT